MKTIGSQTERDGTTHRMFQMPEAEYRSLDDEMAGLCTKCGEERYLCEPDAEKYPCEACQEHAVYGMQQLLIMGLIVLDEDVEPAR